MEILIGFIIGLLLGLTGSGGSLVALPLLFGLLHLSLAEAVAISLGAVAITSSFGLIPRLKAGAILWLHGLIIALFASITTPLGRLLNRTLPTTVVLGIFSLLVIVVAIRLWQQANGQSADTRIVRAYQPETESHLAVCHFTRGRPGPECIIILIISALIIGVLSGLFGVGGGFIIVPVLLFLTGVSMRQAVATSLLVISIVSLSGFAGYMYQGAINHYSELGLIVLGGGAGILVSTLVAQKLTGALFQKIFVIAMVLLSCLIWYRSLGA